MGLNLRIWNMISFLSLCLWIWIYIYSCAQNKCACIYTGYMYSYMHEHKYICTCKIHTYFIFAYIHTYIHVYKCIYMVFHVYVCIHVSICDLILIWRLYLPGIEPGISRSLVGTTTLRREGFHQAWWKSSRHNGSCNIYRYIYISICIYIYDQRPRNPGFDSREI